MTGLTYDPGHPVAFVGDAVKSVTIQSSRNTCTQVSIVENATLIVMYKKGPNISKNISAIKETADMLRKGTNERLHRPMRIGHPLSKHSWQQYLADVVLLLSSIVCVLVRTLHQTPR